MGTELDFEVTITDLNSSIDEWMHAETAPKSELPKLSSLERNLARKMGATQEDYQRMVLAGQLGRMRMKSRGEALGRILRDLLASIGDGLRLGAVQSDLLHARWICRIEHFGRVVSVEIPRDLADDALDFGTAEDFRRLRDRLVGEIGPGLESTKQ